MYVCGPTVYNTVHLGNCRTFISFDLIYRYLKHIGYDIRYIRNITDVGHLEENSDDDKILKRAKIENLEPMEVVQKYSNEFHEIMEKFSLVKPSIEPTASGHIPEQIEMIEEIISNGHAYEKNGSVYFDLNSFSNDFDYGRLSKRNLDDVINESRKLENVSDKKNPQDFALWKKAADKHIMKWNSPWSLGFPGWHLECSAMSKKYLGETFDIHGGGMDLVFPHHEAEIAQSNACYDCDPAKFWMHNNMITINGQKMGKSLGNAVNLEQFFTGNHDLLERAYTPMTIRFFILQAHYRSTVDFSNEALKAAEKGMTKLMNACETLEGLTASDRSSYDVATLKDKCYTAMNDDFNTPILISHLFDGVRIINSIKDGSEQLSATDLTDLKQLFQTFVTHILGLKSNKEKAGNDLTNEVMNIVLRLRSKAKENKDWDSADFIRDELNKLNIQVKDGKDSCSWEFKK